MGQNYNGKLNMLAFKNACIGNLSLKGEKKRCLVIPIEDANLFEGKKGVYFNFTMRATSNSQYGDSHFITQDLPKQVRDAMSDEEKKSQPFFGNIKPQEGYQTRGEHHTTTEMKLYNDDNPNDDLPF